MSFMSKKLCLSVLLASSLAAPLVSMAIEANQVQSRTTGFGDGFTFTLARVSDSRSEGVLADSLRRAGVSYDQVARIVQPGNTIVATLKPGAPVPAGDSGFISLTANDRFTDEDLERISSNHHVMAVLYDDGKFGALYSICSNSNIIIPSAIHGHVCNLERIPNNNP